MKRDYESSITLIKKTKIKQGQQKKKNHKPISLRDVKILNNSKMILSVY